MLDRIIKNLISFVILSWISLSNCNNMSENCLVTCKNSYLVLDNLDIEVCNERLIDGLCQKCESIRPTCRKGGCVNKVQPETYSKSCDPIYKTTWASACEEHSPYYGYWTMNYNSFRTVSRDRKCFALIHPRWSRLTYLIRGEILASIMVGLGAPPVLNPLDLIPPGYHFNVNADPGGITMLTPPENLLKGVAQFILDHPKATHQDIQSHFDLNWNYRFQFWNPPQDVSDSEAEVSDSED